MRRIARGNAFQHEVAALPPQRDRRAAGLGRWQRSRATAASRARPEARERCARVRAVRDVWFAFCYGARNAHARRKREPHTHARADDHSPSRTASTPSTPNTCARARRRAHRRASRACGIRRCRARRIRFPICSAALDQLGIARSAVDLLLLTHVHLDHAGGAGALMQALPNAKAVLHPRGAPHLIEPAKLIAGTRVVYGEEIPAALRRHRPNRRGARHHDAGWRQRRARGPAVRADPHAGACAPSPVHRRSAITPASSPATHSGCRIGSSIPRRARSSCPPRRRRSSIRISSSPRSTASLGYRPSRSISCTTAASPDIPKLAGESQGAGRAVRARSPRRNADPLPRLAKGRDREGHAASCGASAARKHGVQLSDERIDALLKDDADLNAQGLVVVARAAEACRLRHSASTKRTGTSSPATKRSS